MKAANEAMREVANEKDLNVTELNHLIYAAATVIKEEVNGLGDTSISAILDAFCE